MECPRARDSWKEINRTINSKSFQDFVSEAYSSEEGYAIRSNPRSGKKEMFIAGSRTAFDWFLNFWDVFSVDPWRKQKEAYYADLVRTENIEVVYGHSRGGAIVADLPAHPCVQKVGLSAAMVIAKKNKCMLNIHEGNLLPSDRLDEIVSRTGRNNRIRDYSPRIRDFHKVWKVER